LRLLIGWVRRSPETLKFSQLAASHREKETQEHKLVKNKKNR
jgi:hypothetical protein